MAGALGRAVRKVKKQPSPVKPVVTGDRGASAMAEAPKSARPRRMTIEPLDDGTFHIQHEGAEPMATSKKFSARNTKHLNRHVRQTFGKDK